MRVLLLALLCAGLSMAARTLDAYFIDVEGGQSTLIVTPAGESLLIDAGYAGRDADRILAVAKLAGVKQIDRLALTHYHADHVGGVPEIASKLPVKQFFDHGPNTENDVASLARAKAYAAAIGKSPHTVAKPGMRIAMKGVDIDVLAGDQAVIKTPLKGAGGPNPACSDARKIGEIRTENDHSLGMLITFGKFRL